MRVIITYSSIFLLLSWKLYKLFFNCIKFYYSIIGGDGYPVNLLQFQNYNWCFSGTPSTPSLQCHTNINKATISLLISEYSGCSVLLFLNWISLKKKKFPKMNTLNMFLTRDFEICDLSEKGLQKVEFEFIQFPRILVAIRTQCQSLQTKWRNSYTYGMRKFFLLIWKSSSFFRVFISSLKVLTLKIRFLTITSYSLLKMKGSLHSVCMHVKYCIIFLSITFLHLVKLSLLE